MVYEVRIKSSSISKKMKIVWTTYWIMLIVYFRISDNVYLSFKYLSIRFGYNRVGNYTQRLIIHVPFITLVHNNIDISIWKKWRILISILSLSYIYQEFRWPKKKNYVQQKCKPLQNKYLLVNSTGNWFIL